MNPEQWLHAASRPPTRFVAHVRQRCARRRAGPGEPPAADLTQTPFARTIGGLRDDSADR
jgi:hypothetical protein